MSLEEDARFFDHHGVDFLGLARAFVKKLIASAVANAKQKNPSLDVGRMRSRRRRPACRWCR